MRRKRERWACLMAALLLLTALAACGPSPGTGDGLGEAGETVVITDDLGREVEVPFQPRRTAALIGSFAQVWTLAGGELAAAADDAWHESFALELGEGTANLGKTTQISLEGLLAADPDFVLASVNTPIDLKLAEVLEDAGIPTACFDVNDFGEYLSMLERCAAVTGRPDLYQANGAEVAAQVEEVIRRAGEEPEGPSVLYLRATARSVKAKGSEDNVLGEMLRDLGCRNIADGDGTLLDSLSLESIVRMDPDMIFLVKQGDNLEAVDGMLQDQVFGHPAWAGLTAVREGRVYEMDPALYNLKPNHRWGVAYEGLYQILYGAPGD